MFMEMRVSFSLCYRNTFGMHTLSNQSLPRTQPISTLIEIGKAYKELMLTYGNGDLISKMIYTKLHRDYTSKLSEYLADWAGYQAASNDADRLKTPPYPNFNNEWITHYPPAGDGIRDLFEDTCHSRCTPYGVRDHDRCVREIQSVGTNSMFAQDHTMEVNEKLSSKYGRLCSLGCRY